MQYHLASGEPAEMPVQAGLAAANELQALGFGLPGLSGHSIRPQGVAFRACVPTMLGDGESAGQLRHALRRSARQGIPVCILPANLDDGSTVVAQWAAFCQLIHDFGAISPAFCVHSHQLPLREFCDIADKTLGSGQRFVFLDGLQMHPTGNERVETRADSNWAFLWQRRRTSRPLLPVYGGFVRSACPLLADEAATWVLPGSGLQVPSRSAWLPVTLDVTRFADDAGKLDERCMQQALRRGLLAADALVDQLAWSSAEYREDAVQNRRLAITLEGVGDLVVRRRENPADLHCLRNLDGLVALIRQQLDEGSAALAAERGTVPSLEHACPAGDWFDGSHNEIWRRRFDAARQKSAVRHRNLLAISPYAVLPTDTRGDARFADLLPLLRHADAWSFASAAPFHGWNIKQFKHFHKRARAIIQGSQAAAVVAAGV